VKANGTTKEQDTRELLTFSAQRCAQNCPRKYQYRYVEGLKLRAKQHALWFGSLWHDVREAYYRQPGGAPTGLRLRAARAVIDEKLSGHFQGDDGPHDSWHKLHAMIRGYAARWGGGPESPTLLPGEEELADCAWRLDPDLIEFEFRQPVRNPETGAESRTFRSAGKVDGARYFRETGRLWIEEAKTAASVGSNYIEKLWLDSQIHSYARHVGHVLREPVEGILYDAVAKCKVKQGTGERAEEFETRIASYAAELKLQQLLSDGPLPAESLSAFAERTRLALDRESLKWSKKGPRRNESRAEFEQRVSEVIFKLEGDLATAGPLPPETDEAFQLRIDKYRARKDYQRVQAHREAGPRPAETDEAFAARLDEWYSGPEAFTRVRITVDPDRLRDHEETSWDVSQALLQYRKRGSYPRNTSQCYQFASGCAYVPICKNGGLDEVVGNFYEVVPAHEELSHATPADPFGSPVNPSTETERNRHDNQD